MITIIEGADGTGKTTYAQKLSERFNAKYLHAEQPKTRLWSDEYIRPITSQNLILDRWHLGEVVCPKIYGRQSLFDETTFDYCNWELAKLGARLILLTRSEDAIAEELLRRGEELQIDFVLHSRSLFVEAFRQVRYLDKKIIHSEVVR